MKTMEDAQQRPLQREWVCWVCNKQINNMTLSPCCYIPRHLVSFKAKIEYIILTTVCHKCLKISSNYDID